MIFLVDTHLLLRAALEPHKLSTRARNLIEEPTNGLMFSAATIWEIAIKASLGREDFTIDARLMRRGLINNGYTELEITSEHATATAGLPDIHKDPFDRIQIAQARVEGLVLLTSDPTVADYGALIELV